MRDYTSIPFELFIALFSILPFFALAYFYPLLPERVPLFMNLNGTVAVWGEKSWLSVYRVPLMAVITQVFCLLMKYGTLQSEAALPAAGGGDYQPLRQQLARLNVGLWDWFRSIVAFKMSASSLNTIFLSIERFEFLSRPTFIFTFIAALMSVAGGIIYAYRMMKLKRLVKERFGDLREEKRVDAGKVYGRILYFNPSDPAFFVNGYVFNFANKWVYVFIACILAYPLLVFLPAQVF